MIRRCHFIFPTVLLALLAAACQEPMEAASTVSKFRILAVQAEPPEAAPGETVTHRALYADPEGEGRTVSFIWVTCLGMITPSSAGSADCTLLGFGLGDTSSGGDVYETAPIREEDVKEPLDEAAKNGKTYIQATTVLSLCAGGEPLDLTELASGGDIGLGTLEELCIDGEGLTAFKSFRISREDAPDRNTNPTIDYVLFNGNRIYPQDPDTGVPTVPPLTVGDAADKCAEDESCPAGEATKAGVFYCETTSECLDGAPVKAYLTDDSFESYEQTILGETKVEDDAPYISWFMDGGAFSTNWSRAANPPGPFSAVWAPPQTGGKFTLYVVAHDLRGGTSWQRYAVEAVSSALE